MSATFANINPNITSGIVYASDVALTATESDLGTAFVLSGFDSGINAEIQLVIAGGPSGNTGSYVVLQTSWDGTTWFDVAWATTSSTTNSTLRWQLNINNYVASAVTAQTRAAGTSPGATGVGGGLIGGYIRFAGFSGLTGGSIKATVKYILQPLR